MKFRSICLLVQKKKFEIDFQDGSYGMILAIFYLQVTRYFLSRFESIGLLVLEKKFKTDFQDVAVVAILDFW